MPGSVPSSVLLFRVRARLCALPVALVRETMRPLPVEALADAPDFVIGAAMIRGMPTPVVDPGPLIGEAGAPAHTRFVTLRTGEADIAIAVEAVLGFRELPAASFRRLPPLLRDAAGGVLETVALLDAELLSVLKLARTLTDRVLATLQTSGGSG